MIQGDHGPIVICKMTVKEIDLSHIKTKKLSEAESRPLDNKGNPMVELVAKGKDIFTNKGCIECHNTTSDDSIVKTGPSLFSAFPENARTIKVMESAEEHLVDIKADKEYLVESLRDPNYILSLNKRDNNKPFLPIMPIFTPEILKDGDIDALYAYLLTLNPKKLQGLRSSGQAKQRRSSTIS